MTPWINATITPANDLIRDDALDCWCSTGNDPQLHLSNGAGELTLPAGWVELDVRLEFLENARRPRLYWNEGGGVTEQTSMLLPLPVNGRIHRFIYFHRPIAGFRLDPTDCEAKFRVVSLRMRSTSRLAAAGSTLAQYPIKALRQPRLYARILRDLFQLWWHKGIPGLRSAFGELIVTQSGTAMVSNVAAQLAQARSAKAGSGHAANGLGSAALRLGRSPKRSLRIGIGLVEHFGDIVACEPVARQLRAQYPDAEISWVVRDAFRDLIDHNPNIDRTIAVDCLTDWIKWRSHGVFDKIVDLHVNERICQHCRVPLRKTDGDPSITGENHLHHGSLLRAFSRSAGIAPSDEAPRLYIPDATAHAVDRLGLPDRYVVLHCRSNSVEKDWEYDKWHSLAQRIVAELDIPVVEVGLQPTVRLDGDRFLDLCGKTSLMEMAEVIRRAAIFVGIDSGPAHLANAADTPGVVLLGHLAQFKNYNPYSGRYGDESNATLIRNACGPAALIETEAVFDAIRDRLSPTGASRSHTNVTTHTQQTAVEERGDKIDIDPRLIAFYLPQYHPIPENDRAWGKGFTEWRNVGKSRAYFDGQYQPRLPGELGYYDLRLPEIMEQQAALAKEHGIHGFCYYYYWFNGKRLLNLPLDNMLALKRPDFPFCFCWANENWTRRWDGMEREIIVGQNHTPEDDIAFIRFIMPALEDPRYIRVDGKPLLLIYRSELFPNPAASIERWRNEARSAGLGDLFLVRCEGFDPYTDPEAIGFDASYEVPTFILPDELKFEDRESLNVSPEFTGRIYDYKKIVDWYCRRPEAQYRRYRGPMLAWDNTPRHGKNALVFHGATPELYGQWIEDSLAHARRRFRGEERLVFVNAWNEWAEGSYLEPDLKYGHGFLEATRAAVTKQNQRRA